MTEKMIYNFIAKDMSFGGIVFEDSMRNYKKYHKSLNVRNEYDIILINGTMLAIIESKYRVRPKDVTKLFEKNYIILK